MWLSTLPTLTSLGGDVGVTAALRHIAFTVSNFEFAMAPGAPLPQYKRSAITEPDTPSWLHGFKVPISRAKVRSCRDRACTCHASSNTILAAAYRASFASGARAERCSAFKDWSQLPLQENALFLHTEVWPLFVESTLLGKQWSTA
ncbi:hypothetical protein EXIGLDRAFT_295625 [Exidia glandulosa HHB12029]|uniref:Uncharacterized protein n=1 Tax=Exidia glandulosa HHB12029 TaxID=1314781 RepID=A0A165DCC7_EXIGL|nr:hypothetical protein EXIGLDRAFT_295625 [Exidia glandulosa HHB12029]